MKKNQYAKLGLTFLAVMSSLLFSPAQAQTEKMNKEAPVKISRIKILKEENGEYLLLDTTLSVSEGMALEEAVKKLQEGGVSLKSLGAKVVQPSKLMSPNDIESIKVYSLGGSDSLRKKIDVVRFRTLKAGDSLRTVTFSSVLPDSIFTRLREAKVYRSAGTAREALRVLEARPTEISGNRIFVRSLVNRDSLGANHKIFRFDTTMAVRADTIFLRETIRVVKDGEDVKVIRIKKSGTEDLLETGEYDLLKLKGEGQSKVLILRKSKATQKATGKPGKAGKKKEAMVPSKLEMQLYPNPTTDKVSLSFYAPKRTNAQLRVVDSKGKAVYQEDLGTVQGNFTKELDLSTYGKGMYVIQVMIGITAQSGKVVVQ